MGIDHSLLVQYEEIQLRKMHHLYRDFLKRDSSIVKLDAEVRRWIVIRSPTLFSTAEKHSKSEVGGSLGELFGPPNLEDISVFNCIFMRFVDLSPIWVFRDIKTKPFFHSYLAVSLSFSVMSTF
jgi:hypothetical protein